MGWPTMSLLLLSSLLIGCSVSTHIDKGCTTGEISELKVHCNSENSYLILCSESTQAEVMVKITYTRRNYIIRPGEGLPIEINWNAGMGKKSLVKIDNNLYIMTAHELQISVANNASLYYIMCKTPIDTCDGLSDEYRQSSNHTQVLENYQPDFEGVDPEFICSEASSSLHGPEDKDKKKTKRSPKRMTNSDMNEDKHIVFENDESVMEDDLEIWLEGSGFSPYNEDIDPLEIPNPDDLKEQSGPPGPEEDKGHIGNFAVNEEYRDGSGQDDGSPSDLALLEGSGGSSLPRTSCTAGDISELKLHNDSETSYLIFCSESIQAEIEIRITSEETKIASRFDSKYSIAPDIGLPMEIKWNNDSRNKVGLGFAPRQYEYFMTEQQLKITVTNNVAVYYIMCSSPVNQCDAVPYQPKKRVEEKSDSHQPSSYSSMLGLLLGGLFGTLLLVSVYVALIKCYYRRKKESGAMSEKKSNSECGNTSEMLSVAV